MDRQGRVARWHLKLTVTLVLLICVFGLNQSTAVVKPRVYTIGVVPQFSSAKIYATWNPILKELSRRTGYQFKLVGSANIPAFEQKLLQGQFDFAYMNPFHLIKANKAKNYQPVLRDHGRMLYGIIVVKKSSSYQKLEDLANQKVAFPAPNSLGASLLTRSVIDREYKVKIQARYVKSHSSVYLNVVLNQMAAGGGVYKTYRQQPDAIKNQLRILYKTPKVKPHPIAVHPRVSELAKAKIVSALIAMSHTPEGKNLIKKIPIKQLGPASYGDYEPLLKLNLERYWVN